jgi:hypothetical protein
MIEMQLIEVAALGREHGHEYSPYRFANDWSVPGFTILIPPYAVLQQREHQKCNGTNPAPPITTQGGGGRLPISCASKFSCKDGTSA